ncbi:MAG: ABC transporter permease subunit [Planctomycetaceae bacterium]|nr:ABC transporter permease subunit [Planctomycetaceae bacterium]
MQTQQSELPRAGGPERPARPPSGSPARVARRRALDRVARGIVTLGGISVIASIVAILFVIAMEMLPLFRSSSVSPLAPVVLRSEGLPLAVGSDEYREILWTAGASGLSFYSLSDGSRLPIDGDLKAGAVSSSTALSQGTIALGLSDGRAVLAQLSFALGYVDGKRKVEPRFKADPPVTLDAAGRPVRHLVRALTDSGPLLASVSGPRELSILTLKRKKSLMGEGKLQELRKTLPLEIDSEISALAVDLRGEDLYAGLRDGRLLRIDLRDPETPKPAVPILAASRPGTAITALAFLNGERTLALGDAAGAVSTWQMLRSEEGSYYLTRVHAFDPHDAPIASFGPSLRDKGFLSADAKGAIHLNHSTTAGTLVKVPATDGTPGAAVLTPKSDGIVSVNSTGKVYRWDVRNPHPETTLRSLFGSVWYEGYPEPDTVWQSTGGTDDFEPKFGLYPLIVGTLKGTFYALILAVPLALLSALYVSQFMHPALKQNIKPLIEVMAALPSVVLGFIAALWLAPNLERRIPGIFLLPIVETALILLTVAAWRSVPLGFRQRFRHGSEVALIIPVVLIGAALSFWLGGVLEASALGGDYQAWFLRVLGLSYDQRNSVVVGLAMGFAVIPIIFTIAEDSLSNVPPYLAAGSLALGATRWQTALKVVLPSASPGIFSAIMIGFGRAVGETMIVLMATGNTPVMNWNPFKGFRALSANIAVELPEAAVGGTLYRVLFLTAFLLFLMTFTVNTLAELIRLRLRKKFQQL